MAATVAGQVNPAPRPKEVLLNYDGKPVPNDEFRDYSLSDPIRKDPFTRTIRPDGTVELRLNKNAIEGNDISPFSVTTIDGKILDSASLKGKVLVLNLWFIGCPGCMEEIPRLNQLAAKYPDRDRVVFLAISTDAPALIADFIKRTPFDYLHVGDARGAVAQLGVRTFPRNAVIGKDGKIAYWRSTVKAWYQFESAIEAELSK